MIEIMMKLINIFIVFSIFFTGCTVVKEPIFIETKCPRIETVKKVPKIEGNITNDCVCGDNLYDLLKTTQKLRDSEAYYYNQVSKYNKKFTKPSLTK